VIRSRGESLVLAASDAAAFAAGGSNAEWGAIGGLRHTNRSQGRPTCRSSESFVDPNASYVYSSNVVYFLVAAPSNSAGPQLLGLMENKGPTGFDILQAPKTPPAADSTTVGSYFVSNYPPYSFWKP
jgi:hypothetical protein